MKKSELRKLMQEYKNLKLKKHNKHDLSQNHKISEKLKEIKHQYFHETGNDIESDLKVKH